MSRVYGMDLSAISPISKKGSSVSPQRLEACVCGGGHQRRCVHKCAARERDSREVRRCAGAVSSLLAGSWLPLNFGSDHSPCVIGCDVDLQAWARRFGNVQRAGRVHHSVTGNMGK